MAGTQRSNPAPEGPRNRTPVRVRTRRTASDVVKAVLAFLALAALLVGVPAALAFFVGWPLPHGMPSLDSLQDEISVGLFVKVLTVVVWVAWAQFAACVLVEVKAVVSGVGMPARVPGAGMSQLMARQLVAAVLLLGSTAASFAPGLSQWGQSPQQHVRPPAASAQQLPGQHAGDHQRSHGPGREAGGGQQAGQDAQQGADATPGGHAQGQEDGGESEKGTKFYRIHPPEGRHHDSLWEVAHRHLGDGRRYKEIYQLNKDRTQPDGSKLSEASLIRPGWILQMPADAHGGDLVEMPDDSSHVEKELRERIRDYQETAGHGQTDGAQQAGQAGRDADSSPDGQARQAHQVGQDGEGGREERNAEGPRAAESARSAEDESFGWPEALVGAPLLAAGVLAALGRRQRHALWQAAAAAAGRGSGGAGREPDPLSDPAASAREALLVGADPEGVRFLDRALRGLAASLAAEGRALPTVYVAWLTAGELHLQLAAEAGEPPAPWRLGQGPSFWALDRSAVGTEDAGPDASGAGTQAGDAGTEAYGDGPAPYPGLVSLGAREDARLLLNLESAPGLVSVTGGADERTGVLASLAAELATSGWSDRMTVTLVGFGAELATLAPTRVRHVAEVAGLLEAMEAETEQRRGALRGAGHSTVLTGRAAGSPSPHQQWAPHLVLVGAEPSDEEAGRLAELAAGADALGIGYLVATERSELPGAGWEFEVSADGELRAPLMGLRLRAQTLPERVRSAVVELFAHAETGERPAAGGSGEEPGAGGPRFRVDLTESGRPAVYVRLMGPYEIMGLEEPDTGRSVLLREALALLLLKREGVHPRVLASALWPKGVTADVRDALIDRLTRWLGDGPDGAPLLRTDERGRLVLAESVVSDWDVLRTLHHGATGERGARLSPAVRQRQLTDALDLARGPLLAQRPEGRYGWLAHELAELRQPLLVAELGLELADVHLGRERPQRAVAAVSNALRAAPADERLWNELLRAAHATEDGEQFDAAVAWIVEQNRAVHGPARGLPPRTQALLEELAPERSRTAGAAGEHG